MNPIDNYDILTFLGEGTFGVVKLGVDKSTEEKVAIKIIEKKRILDKVDERHVKREIDILKKINHLNVIKTKKIFEDSENIYIIMEYCEKGELFDYIVKEICLSGKEASYYFYQLINGLENIHKKGLVHRDVKPENLLINKNNILKIIDFGLSNYYDGKKLLSTFCGSPSYTAPEMLTKEEYDGIMADIWSTGIVLYTMLCGCLPFEDEDKEILFKKIINGKIDYPDNLEEDAVDLMKKILIIDPKKRISIQNIKKHDFYQKGRKEFFKKHYNILKKSREKKREKNDQIKYKVDNIIRNQKTINNLKIKTDFNDTDKVLEDKNQIYNKIDNKNKGNIKAIINQNMRKNKKNTEDKFTQKTDKTLLQQNYFNNNFESNDDIIFQGNETKNDYKIKKNLTINDIYDLNNKTSKNKKIMLDNTMRIAPKLRNLFSNFKNNINNFQIPQYLPKEIINEKMNNTINSIQNKKNIKINKKNIVALNKPNYLKFKEKKLQIKKQEFTDNIIDDIMDYIDKKKQKLADKKINDYKEYNTLQNKNEYFLKDDFKDNNYIYINTSDNQSEEKIKNIKNNNNSFSTKKVKQIYINKKSANNRINILNDQKEINNLTSENNSDINSIRNILGLKGINSKYRLNKKYAANTAKIKKLIKINNNKNFIINKIINNNFINYKNSSSFLFKKNNFKKKIYTKLFHSQKNIDLIKYSNIYNNIYSSQFLKKQLQFNKTYENINKNIKELELNNSEKNNLHHEFKNKLKNNKFNPNYSNRGRYISPINKSIGQQKQINNKIINDEINNDIININSLNNLNKIKKYNKKQYVMNNKEINNINNKSLDNKKETKKLKLKDEMEKKIQEKICLIRKNNLPDLITNTNKSLLNKIIYNKTKSEIDSHQVKYYPKTYRKIEINSYNSKKK